VLPKTEVERSRGKARNSTHEQFSKPQIQIGYLNRTRSKRSVTYCETGTGGGNFSRQAAAEARKSKLESLPFFFAADRA
jgi:hypothetical protein